MGCKRETSWTEGGGSHPEKMNWSAVNWRLRYCCQFSTIMVPITHILRIWGAPKREITWKLWVGENKIELMFSSESQHYSPKLTERRRVTQLQLSDFNMFVLPSSGDTCRSVMASHFNRKIFHIRLIHLKKNRIHRIAVPLTALSH